MTNYYITENGKIILFDTDLQRLKDTIEFMPQYAEFEILETEREILDFEFTDTVEYEEMQKKKEFERIQSLFMTRSDFITATIKAWNVGDEELLIILEKNIEKANASETVKKLAINNFKNALHFYRNHPLFDALVDIPLFLNDTQQLIITSEQWDRFFDETSKGNKDSYLELPVLITVAAPVQEEIILAENIDVQ